MGDAALVKTREAKLCKNTYCQAMPWQEFTQIRSKLHADEVGDGYEDYIYICGLFTRVVLSKNQCMQGPSDVSSVYECVSGHVGGGNI